MTIETTKTTDNTKNDNQTDNQTADDNLSAEEKSNLKSCEASIRNGLQSFYKVGEALNIIRTFKLYRATHKTFDKYAADKWDMTRQRTTQLTNAHKVYAVLSDANLKPLPANEPQCRPFNKVPNDAEWCANVTGIWQAVIDSDAKITAKLVTTVTADYLGLEQPKNKTSNEQTAGTTGTTGNAAGSETEQSASAADRERIRELNAKIAYLESALAAEKLAHKRTIQAAKGSMAPNSKTAKEMYKAGFRAMARQHHPDNGGSVETMQELNQIKETLGF